MPHPAVPRIDELAAPSHWRTVDFISDIHLQPAEPATFEAWRRYLGDTPADAVFILGDLFEAWPGDDAAAQPGFAAECAAVLRATAQHRDVLFMHGNRDFLVGPALAASTGIRLLNDPTVLAFETHRWLLTHGDALCLGDTEYLAFRAQVRAPAWQQAFLARPLAEREAVARALRDQSEARKRSGTSDYADVDTDAALAWLHAAQAPVLLHGHTHRPGEHRLDDTRRRIVLSDWDAAVQPARLQVLRLDRGGAQRVDLS